MDNRIYTLMKYLEEQVLDIEIRSIVIDLISKVDCLEREVAILRELNTKKDVFLDRLTTILPNLTTNKGE